MEFLCYLSSSSVVFVFAFAALIGVIIYRSRTTSEKIDIPTYNIGPIPFYYLGLKALYKNKRIAPEIYILQVVCCFYKLFGKKPIGSVWMLFRRVIMILKAEAVEIVLGSHTIIDKSKEYHFLHEWLGTGLLTSSREKWRSRRKLLTPSFHFRILDEFVPVFDDESRILVEKLAKDTQKGWVDIVPLVTMCTLDIICETTMGVRIGAQQNPEGEYVKAIHVISELVWYRLARPWFWNDTLFFLTAKGKELRKTVDIVQRITKEVIKKKKAEILEKNSNEKIAKESENQGLDGMMRRKKAFLELLLELHINDNAISEDDIREEVNTFMFEGHDTTAMAISWALYNIGLYQEVQQKINQELEDIFGDDKNRPVTSDDIKAMKYLECVLKESLRLYPSVPVIAREVNETTDIMGHVLKPGSAIVICTYMIHRDSDVYSNPEAFDPDRFQPENCVGRHPYAYIPFSAGPRNCIGQKFALMEEKTVLANVLRNFRIESLDQKDRIHVMTDVILRSSGPLRLRFVPR